MRAQALRRKRRKGTPGVSLLTLVDKMAKEYAVPVPDAFLAIVDAKGVYTDHIESMVELTHEGQLVGA